MNRKHSRVQEDVVVLTANLTQITKAIIRFLQMFMTDTLAKRIVSMILIAVGIKDDRVAEATGLSERSIWSLRKTMVGGNIDSLFEVGSGSGRPVKTKDLENAIVEELEKNNYHTRQQIADMILEKFGVTMSVSTVGRLLKKTASSG
jgi:transposase